MRAAAIDSDANPAAGHWPLERVTVNVTGRAARALDLTAELTGDTKTDALNRALQIYAYLEQVTARGGSFTSGRQRGPSRNYSKSSRLVHSARSSHDSAKSGRPGSSESAPGLIPGPKTLRRSRPLSRTSTKALGPGISLLRSVYLAMLPMVRVPQVGMHSGGDTENLRESYQVVNATRAGKSYRCF
jgi:hypothetical protein